MDYSLKKIKTGFDSEHFRNFLLEKKEFKALLGTYYADLPEIKDQNSPEFWDKKFSHEIDSELFPMSIDRNKIVANLIKPNTKVLNIGAGKGYLEANIAKRLGKNIKWTGTDFTHESLKKLNFTFGSENKFLKYTFVKTKLSPLPFKDNSFDTVCLLEVLEHIQPKETFSVLKEIYRVAKKGGKIIISVPINEGLEAMMPDNPNSHLRVYTKKLLQFELEAVGFSIKKVLKLSAFSSHYKIKKLINSFFNIRKANNLIFILEK